MPLTKRDLFDLRIALAKQYDSTDKANRIKGMAGLDKAEESDYKYERWKNILDKAIETDKLEKLLQVVIDDMEEQGFPGENYQDWLAELKTGIPKRLHKLAMAIRDGQCVLFLGAGTLLCSGLGGKLVTFSQAFAQKLSALMDDNNIYYDQTNVANASLSYIAQCYMANNIPGMQGEEAKKFYKKCLPNTSLYGELAQLPWRVVINTNPDSELATILNKKEADSCVHKYYNMTNNAPLAATPTANSLPTIELLKPGQTLLYNVFGSFDDRLSIILTESQLLDFTNRILNKNPGLDPLVMDEFAGTEDTPKTYLFLGFDFDQWYVKIIFQTVLKLIKQKDRSYSVFPTEVSYNQFNRDFFEDEFKCYFIDDKLEQFVKDLVEAYQKLPIK